MKSTTLLASLAMALLLGLYFSSSPCHGQPAPAPTDEWKVLERFVGIWDNETTAKPAEWTPQGFKATATNQYQWVLDKRFLQYTEPTALGLWTYDPSAKMFRGWFYGADGNVLEWKGQWDNEAPGLRMEANLANGIVMTGINRFPDKDTYEWTLLAKDKAGKVYLDMKETHRRRKSAPTGPATGEPEEGKEGDRPVKPPELQILKRYLGTWNTEIVNKMAEWTPQEGRITGTFTNDWVLDGRFLQMKGKTSGGVETLQLRTYDPQKKHYRAWVFDSRGTAATSNGQWNEGAQTLTWKGELANGITASNTVRFVGDDSIEWKLIANNGEGKVFLDMDGKFSRRK